MSQKYTRINKNVGQRGEFALPRLTGGRASSTHGRLGCQVMPVQRTSSSRLTTTGPSSCTQGEGGRGLCPRRAHEHVADDACGREPATAADSQSVRSQAQKTNPVAYWKVCHQRINAIEFRQTACTWPWSVAMGACASLISQGRVRALTPVTCRKVADRYKTASSVPQLLRGAALRVLVADGSYVLTAAGRSHIYLVARERRLVARFQATNRGAVDSVRPMAVHNRTIAWIRRR